MKMDLGCIPTTDSEIFERIFEQLQSDKFKKRNGCYFVNMEFQNFMKEHCHLLKEINSKKREIGIISNTSDKNSVRDTNIYEFTVLESGFVKCWITYEMNRNKECLFNVEFNGCSCDKKYTWEQIFKLCGYDEDEANRRLIQNERPKKDNGLKKTNI